MDSQGAILVHSQLSDSSFPIILHEIDKASLLPAQEIAHEQRSKSRHVPVARSLDLLLLFSLQLT